VLNNTQSACYSRPCIQKTTQFLPLKLFSHPGLFPREQAKKLANEREITRSGAGNNLKNKNLGKVILYGMDFNVERITNLISQGEGISLEFKKAKNEIHKEGEDLLKAAEKTAEIKDKANSAGTTTDVPDQTKKDV
jgi:hypothetical protein